MNLFVVFAVHEIVEIAVHVKKLHRPFAKRDSFEYFGGGKPKFLLNAILDASHFGLNEGAEVAGSFVDRFEAEPEFAIVLDDIARTKLVCGDGHSIWGPAGPLRLLLAIFGACL